MTHTCLSCSGWRSECLLSERQLNKIWNVDCTALRVWNVKRASFLLGVGAFMPTFYRKGVIPLPKCWYRSIDCWCCWNF